MAATVRAPFPAGTVATLGGTTSVTTSVTVVAGDVLEAHVVVSTGSDTGMSLSATANGAAADGSSAIVHSNGQTAGFERVFYWLAPAAGTYNVVATLSGGTADSIAQKVYAVAGTDGAAPSITTFQTGNTTNITSISCTSAVIPTNGIGISHFCAGSAFTSLGGSTTTLLNDVKPGGSSAANDMAGGSAAGAGSTIAFTAAFTSDWAAAIVTVWAPAGGAAAYPFELLTHTPRAY
jgi:hypothetical protein